MDASIQTRKGPQGGHIQRGGAREEVWGIRIEQGGGEDTEAGAARAGLEAPTGASGATRVWGLGAALVTRLVPFAVALRAPDLQGCQLVLKSE
jgi:hypothetical protein